MKVKCNSIAITCSAEIIAIGTTLFFSVIDKTLISKDIDIHTRVPDADDYWMKAFGLREINITIPPNIALWCFMFFDIRIEDLDNIILDWEEEVNQDQVLELSQKWITSKNFLTTRMIGLTHVGESSLTIEPVD